jgi:hypothetical protein
MRPAIRLHFSRYLHFPDDWKLTKPTSRVNRRLAGRVGVVRTIADRLERSKILGELK